MKKKYTRKTLEEIRKLKRVPHKKRIKNTSESEIRQQIDDEPDLYHLTDDEYAEFKPTGKDNDK